jgi:ElaB/YqjD/DUF883 family membrane-anchored ribosome-binding protein
MSALPNSTSQQLNDGIDSAASAARQATQQAFDQADSALSSVRSKITPAVSRLTTQAQSLAGRGLHAMRDGASMVKDRASHAGDVTVRYVKDEPVKSVLIAAAAGAALMGILALLNSRRNRL